MPVFAARAPVGAVRVPDVAGTGAGEAGREKSCTTLRRHHVNCYVWICLVNCELETSGDFELKLLDSWFCAHGFGQVERSTPQKKLEMPTYISTISNFQYFQPKVLCHLMLPDMTGSTLCRRGGGSQWRAIYDSEGM